MGPPGVGWVVLAPPRRWDDAKAVCGLYPSPQREHSELVGQASLANRATYIAEVTSAIVSGRDEGWFKVVKHRFGLHRFGQATYQGVYRWLVISLIAFTLAGGIYYWRVQASPIGERQLKLPWNSSSQLW